MSRTHKFLLALALLVTPLAVAGCTDSAGPSEPSAPAFDTGCAEGQGSVC